WAAEELEKFQTPSCREPITSTGMAFTSTESSQHGSNFTVNSSFHRAATRFELVLSGHRGWSSVRVRASLGCSTFVSVTSWKVRQVSNSRKLRPSNSGDVHRNSDGGGPLASIC